MRILAMDPGKLNWAWALFENGVVIDYGQLTCLLTEVDKASEQLPVFKAGFKKLLARCELNPETDHVYAERFMFRPGGGRGCVGEFVNIQIGIILVLLDGIPLTLFSSALWKRGMALFHNIPKGKTSQHILKVLNGGGDKKRKLTAHEADAIGIGMYFQEKERKVGGVTNWRLLHASVALPDNPPTKTVKSKAKPRKTRRKKKKAKKAPSPRTKNVIKARKKKAATKKT